MRILLAEDNPVNQKLAKMMLTKAGYRVDLANNGQEAFDKYTSSPQDFDLILMDVQMPRMDGIEATKAIRNWEDKFEVQSSEKLKAEDGASSDGPTPRRAKRPPWRDMGIITSTISAVAAIAAMAKSA